MFEAVRARLIGAWHEVRERGFVSLFFFELLVVTLGVLLAQAIADRANRREELAAMESAKARADLEMGDAVKVGHLWETLGQCIGGDVEAIFRATQSNEPINASLLRRPGTFITAVMPLDERTKLLIRERYGDDAAYNYDWMQRLAERFNAKADKLSDDWGRLELFGAQFGILDAADRAFIRQTASIIKADLEAARSTAREIVRIGNRLKLEPKIIGEYRRFARDCDEYRARGRRMSN